MERHALDSRLDFGSCLAKAEQARAQRVCNRALVLVADCNGALEVAVDQSLPDRPENLSSIDFDSVEHNPPLNDDYETEDRAEQHGVHCHPTLDIIINQRASH